MEGGKKVSLRRFLADQTIVEIMRFGASYSTQQLAVKKLNQPKPRYTSFVISEQQHPRLTNSTAGNAKCGYSHVGYNSVLQH